MSSVCDKLKKICEQIEKEQIKGPSGNLVEIEIFGHGALCIEGEVGTDTLGAQRRSNFVKVVNSEVKCLLLRAY